jgi:hypothetical protein
MPTIQEQIDILRQEIDLIKSNQLRSPLDLESAKLIADILANAQDNSTTRTQSLLLSGLPETITVPKMPDGFIKFKVLQREVWIPFFNV